VTGEYVFVDEWDVRAPVEEVFEALADARTYPAWWRPVYLSVEADGPPEVGRTSLDADRVRERGVVHVHFDWRVNADRPLLRYLTPVLRPLFRWNHDWAIARATEGLEPYAQGLSRSQAASPS
jgi:hypothetical protein